MNTYFIRKSKTKSAGYLALSMGLLVAIICMIISDNITPPRTFSVYWIGIILSGALTLYFLYELLDNKPLYTINEIGIFKGNKSLASWAEISSIKLQTINSRYINRKLVILLDQDGKSITNIEITSSAMTLEEFGKLLNKYVRQEKT